MVIFLVVPLLMQPSVLFAFCAATAHCSLTLGVCQDHQISFHRASPLLGRYWFMPHSWVMFPQVQDLTLVFVEFCNVSSLFQTIQVFLQGGSPSSVSISPLSLVLTSVFIRMHLIPSCRSLAKILNSLETRIGPWESSLVTNCEF